MKSASEGYFRRFRGSYSSLLKGCTISAHVTKAVRLCNSRMSNLDEYLYLTELVAVLNRSYKCPDPKEQSTPSPLFILVQPCETFKTMTTLGASFRGSAPYQRSLDAVNATF